MTKGDIDDSRLVNGLSRYWWNHVIKTYVTYKFPLDDRVEQKEKTFYEN